VTPRLLGAALEPLADYHEQRTRTSRLFVELERLFPIAGFVRPVLRGPADWAIKARAFHPQRDAWRGRAWLSPKAFRLRTELAGRELSRREGDYDVVLQLQTLFAPGEPPAHPYAVYTDNTYTLTRRHYPAWAPLGEAAAREWIELEQATCRNAAVVFATSEWAQRAVVDDYGCDPERVVSVGAGSNLVAEVAGKGYSPPVALFVGNKYELKGVPTLLRAWELVRRELPQARLRVVGLDSRGEVPGVEWLGWVTDRAVLEREYAQASVFVLPSRFEAFATALLEAMGSGLPCVATAVGGSPEIVTEGETGLLVPPDDAEALAAALSQLLSDPTRAERLGRAGHARVLERLNWRAVAERMAPYLGAASSSGPPARP
jgi:alpha-maltose-1-phosphate synthase